MINMEIKGSHPLNVNGQATSKTLVESFICINIFIFEPALYHLLSIALYENTLAASCLSSVYGDFKLWLNRYYNKRWHRCIVNKCIWYQSELHYHNVFYNGVLIHHVRGSLGFITRIYNIFYQKHGIINTLVLFLIPWFGPILDQRDMLLVCRVLLKVVKIRSVRAFMKSSSFNGHWLN